MKLRVTRLGHKLPGARWLPERVARIRASIHTKLLAAFLGMMALLVVLGAVGLGALQSADKRATELVQLERQIAAYRQLQHNTREQLHAVASAFLAADERELDATLRWLQRLNYDFDRAEYVARDDNQLLRDIKAEYGTLIETGTQIIEFIRSEQSDAARALHQEHSVPLASRLERRIFALVNKAEANMVETADISGEAYRVSQIAVITASLTTILLALVLGYSISLSLIEPVRRIRARLRSIAEGDFEGRLEVSNRDELGDLARNVNRMSRKLNQLYGELETANRHKSAFLANMSHELRTPMNAIIGFNRLVMRRCKDILPEKHYENLGKIGVSADHLLTLINTILDLSKVEAGHMEVRPNAFELAPLLEVCARTAEPLLDGKEVEFVMAIPPEIPVLCTDQNMVRQIVLNLLSNAAKFTEQGQIVLAAKADNDMVSMSVSDTGIGIPKDQLSQIFEEFTQIDSSATRQHAGTGLGLAISQRFANLLGGCIEIESEPGMGSTFTVTVPLRFPDVDALEVEPDGESEPAKKRVAS